MLPLHAGRFVVDATVSIHQEGIEPRLSPLGACRLLGQPMADLANRSVALDDAYGAHLIHEFRHFAGDTPQGLVRRRLAGGGGFAAD